MNMFKKLVSLTLCVFVALGAVACGSAPASGPEPSPSASGSTSESQATSEVEGEKDENGMYPDQAWEQLTAQYEAPVAITLWVPNSATSTMGAGIQMLADEFNAQQEKEHPGKTNPAHSMKSCRLLFFPAITRSFLQWVCRPYPCMPPRPWICARYLHMRR